MKSFKVASILISLVALATVVSAGEDPQALQVGAIKPADPSVALDAGPLSAALDSPSKQVRYHAAAALAKVGSRVQFLGSEKVVPLLSEALSERGARIAFVAAKDVQVLNLLQDALRKRGYIVDTAQTPEAALNMAFSAPLKDILFVDSALRDALKVMLRDYRTSTQPMVLIAEEGEVADLKAVLKARAAGFIAKPADAAAIEATLTEVLKNVPEPPAKSLASQFNLLAANALAGIDVATTRLNLAEAVPSLIDALKLGDDVKLPCIACLGNIATPDAAPSLILIAGSTGETEAARLAAIAALDRISRKAGQMDPKAAELMDKLMLDPLVSVRHAAAVALGATNPVDSALKRLSGSPQDVPGPKFGE